MTRGGPIAGGSLVEVFRSWAEAEPTRPAYAYLADGEVEGDTLTWSELDRAARSVGARLAAAGLSGERVLLLHPPGLDFVVGFLGCLMAGGVAVPVQPPGSRRHVGRLAGVVADAAPAAVLTTAALRDRLEPAASEVPGLAECDWIVSERVTDESEELWTPPVLAPDDLAFLQYTSGSTGDPKGVMVSHGNLLRNEEAIRRAFRQDERSVVVSWLPLYHDMGLIGGVLQPLYTGARCVLMSPAAFLQRPARWLEAVARYRATTSGGPDFAYDLCVRRIAAADRAALDLSSWRVAFDGAEPVRPATLDRFVEAFGGAGFRRDAFFPC